MTARYRIGKWFVDPGANEVDDGSTRVKLSPRAARVLAYLAENAGQVVTNEALLAKFWRGSVSSSNSVHKAIAELREAFDDQRGAANYIETVTKRGYRLVAEVQLDGGQTPDSAPEPAAPIPEPGSTVEAAALAPEANASAEAALAGGANTPAERRLRARWRVGRAALVLGALAAFAALAAFMGYRQLVPALHADVVWIGQRSALVLPITETTGNAAEMAFLHALRAQLLALAAKWNSKVAAGPASRIDIRGDSDGVAAARALRSSYMVSLGATTAGSRSQITLSILPATAGLPTHTEQFDIATAQLMPALGATASHIAVDLGVLLDAEQSNEMREWGTTNIHAYRDARIGDRYQSLEEAGSLRQAARYFWSAATRDPSFEYAYVSLAYVYGQLGAMADTEQELEDARRHMLTLSRAVAVHRLPAGVSEYVDQCRRALSIASASDYADFWRDKLLRVRGHKLKYPIALIDYVPILLGAGLVDEAERYWSNAVALLRVQGRLAPVDRYRPQFDLARRNYDGAAKGLRQVLDVYSNSPLPLFGLVRLKARAGRFAEAERYLAMLQGNGQSVWFEGARAHLLAARGGLPADHAGRMRAVGGARIPNHTRGAVCFESGDVECGVQYWRATEPRFLRLSWSLITQEEAFWAEGVLADQRYQALLEELGIGRRYRAHVRAQAVHLASVTGIPVTTKAVP